MPTVQMEAPRLLSPDELALLTRLLRESRKWSQETLSQLSGLSVRTIQRVETCKPSDLDTRRALARAFEVEDIDAFNKPYEFPTAEEIKANQEKFEREHITLRAERMTSGRSLATNFESSAMGVTHAAIELEAGPAADFAALTDYLNEYRDCAELYSATDKLAVYADIQGYLDALDAAGIAVCCSLRDTKLVGRDWVDKAPLEAQVIYMTAFPKDKVPEKIFVLRKFRVG